MILALALASPADARPVTFACQSDGGAYSAGGTFYYSGEFTIQARDGDYNWDEPYIRSFKQFLERNYGGEFSPICDRVLAEAPLANFAVWLRSKGRAAMMVNWTP